LHKLNADLLSLSRGEQQAKYLILFSIR
jgi:hypothetical protein